MQRGLLEGVKRGDTVLEARGITKRFPGVVANDRIDFEMRAGEIHAILGENGAGKSTLMKILYGLMQPDEGEIYVGGKKVKLHSPQDAIDLGIGMVHQSRKLVSAHTVLENIVLGHPRAGRVLNLKRAGEEISELCNRYGLDTISAGATIAFAIECYEKGLITKKDTDGIEMTWGNHKAIVAMTEKLAKREGFGAVLADGVKAAAQKIIF